MPELSIILPCYNEELNLPLIIERFAAVRGECPVELILVNNGSTDNSAAILEGIFEKDPSPNVKVVTVPKNKGYGHGILSGLRNAGGEFLAWTHADLQTDLLDVIKGLEKLKQSPRPQETLLRGRRIGRPVLDNFFTWGMSVFSTITLRTRLYDINAQPKIFHRNLLDKMVNAPDDFSLDLYLLFLVHRLGWDQLELPVVFGLRKHGEAKGGGTMKGKIKLIKRTLRYIIELRNDIKAGLR